MEKIIVTSGYYNPLHVGHLQLFKEAKKLGRLWVIVNNDKQVKLKGKPFMNQKERVDIVRAIRYVDRGIIAIDTDRTVCKTLELLQPDIFVKGGDSTRKNTPELELCKKLGIKVIFGVGGKKIQSSSWLLT
jgi:cytidyltransferase-like protein